jgi:D-alanyl-D-alanine carboxypeptidase (penicillin-binding protein 5/6)
MARFRLTVEVGAARGAARRTLRRPGSPARPSSVRRAIPIPAPLLRRFGLGAALLVLAVSTWDYVQPINAVAATIAGPAQYSVPGISPSLPWPDVGSAAVGASGLGLIATSGDAAPTPMASVAKVMTALVVLADKPMALGDTGPTLTITDQDVALYKADAADQQSVVKVVAGEQLNEFQALEGLLVGSGNNIAETLARWDAGSVIAFVTRMNQEASRLHLAHTTFADTAGVSVQTVSTPSDLVALGIAAMQKEVLAQIVNLPQATLPVAGTVYNVNSALGASGIIGIKTGFGLGLGANFLFAAAATVDGQRITLFGCSMGQPTLDAAFKSAQALIDAMKPALHVRRVVARDGPVGAYATAWGSHTDIVATADVTLIEWPGMKVRQQLAAPAVMVDSPVPGGTPAGHLQIGLGDQQFTIPLVTASRLDPPGITWRLWRVGP